MSTASTFQAILPGPTGGRSASLLVNGTDVASVVTGCQIHLNVDEIPQVDLQLIFTDILVKLPNADITVIMSDAVKDALMALGWTPPEDTP